MIMIIADLACKALGFAGHLVAAAKEQKKKRRGKKPSMLNQACILRQPSYSA
jgi:hypothetical protein